MIKFWKRKKDRSKEILDLAEKSQKALVQAATDTLNLSKDLTSTLQAKLNDYASQIDTTSRLLSDALVLVDEFGVIHSFNNSAEAMFGWSKREIINQSFLKLFDIKYNKDIDLNYMEEFCDEVNSDDVYVTVKFEKFMGVKKDGSTFFIDVSASKFTTSNHKMNYLILVRDVSKRVENEKYINKLSKRNNELASAINASNTGIVLIEPDGYEFKFVFVNKGFEQMTGLSRDQLLKTNLRSVIGSDVGYWNIRKCLNSKMSCQHEIILSSGEKSQWVDIHITPSTQSNDDVELWILVFYNVNDLKNAYEQLSHTHKKFSAFSEASSEALMIHNGEKILEWNRELEILTGYSSDELSTIKPECIAHPLERETFRNIFKQLSVLNNDSLILTKSGEILEVTVNSKNIYWGDEQITVTVIRDVTRFKDINYQLKTSRERYRTVIDNTFDLICCFDKNFVITFTNQTFTDYFGCESAIGYSVLDIIPQEDHENFVNYILSLSKEEPIKRGIHRIQNADGIRWTDWIDKAIFDDNGNIVEYQSVCRDVSHILKKDFPVS